MRYARRMTFSTPPNFQEGYLAYKNNRFGRLSPSQTSMQTTPKKESATLFFETTYRNARPPVDSIRHGIWYVQLPEKRTHAQKKKRGKKSDACVGRGGGIRWSVRYSASYSLSQRQRTRTATALQHPPRPVEGTKHAALADWTELADSNDSTDSKLDRRSTGPTRQVRMT